MYYTVYKITNLINQKIYIGIHKTNNLNDDYMGSGLLIKRAIKKYGIENFKKEYLSIFDNPEEMFEMESTIVNEEFITNTNNYNLTEGGKGGNNLPPDHWTHSREYLNSISIFCQKTPKAKKIQKEAREKGVSTLKQKIKENGGIWWNTNTFQGKKHTEESKKKMSLAKKGKGKGKNNSQYGTCWIYNPTKNLNRKINKEDINKYISDGWIKGRKIKLQ